MFTRIGSFASRGLGRRSASTLLAGALCVAVVAATPATAHAETLADADTVGDMAKLTYTEEEGETLVPAPERRSNDVTRTRLTHGARRVGVRVNYVDLKRKPGEIQVLNIVMMTDEGVRRYLQVAARRRHWSGDSQMYNRRWRPVECSVRHAIDYEANVIKVSFPRRCASTPRWVRFRIGSFVESEGGFFADDALRDRPLTVDDRNLKRSERVHREPAS